MINTSQKDYILISIYVITLGIIFFIDLMIPLGVAVGVPYVIPVLITIKSERKRDTYLVGIAGIILTILGYTYSPCAGGVPWMVIFNRVIAILMIALTTFFVIDRKKSEKKIKDLNRELHSLAHTDPLTGIGNRLLFSKQLEEELERVKRYDTPLSIIMLDIDFFKKINDTYGHGIGDEVLKKLTEVISKNLRKLDKFFRIGGEEFVILLPGTDIEKAKIVAEKLRELVCKTKFNKVNKVTISIGVTQARKDDTPDTLLTRVDKTLYKAKNNGRNRVEVG